MSRIRHETVKMCVKTHLKHALMVRATREHYGDRFSARGEITTKSGKLTPAHHSAVLVPFTGIFRRFCATRGETHLESDPAEAWRRIHQLKENQETEAHFPKSPILPKNPHKPMRQRPSTGAHPHSQTRRKHRYLWEETAAPTSRAEPYQRRIPCMARVPGASSLHPPAEEAALRRRRRRRRRRVETEDEGQRCCVREVDPETEEEGEKQDRTFSSSSADVTCAHTHTCVHVCMHAPYASTYGKIAYTLMHSGGKHACQLRLWRAERATC